MASILAWDIALFKIINSGHTPFLDRFFSLACNLGNGLVMFPLFFAVIFWKKPKACRKTLLILAAVALALGGIINASVKELVGRPRPPAYFVVPGTNAPEEAARSFEVHVVGKMLSDDSFPSGHTNTAFCLATLALLVFGRQFWPVYILAAMAAFSRVYLGFHFPLDTLAGASLGISVALVVWLVARKLRFLEPIERVG